MVVEIKTKTKSTVNKASLYHMCVCVRMCGMACSIIYTAQRERVAKIDVVMRCERFKYGSN